MDTYLDIMNSYCLSVLNSEWTNSAKHSGPLNVYLRWTAMNFPLQKLSPFLFFLLYCFLCCFAFSWVCWRCRRIRRICFYRAGEGLCYLIDRITRRI